jgi:FMN phosphatase YigB (HAD superfamily)
MRASEAVMIGDRLSKDIRPARLLASKTIRVARGFARFESLRASRGGHLAGNRLAEVAPALT